VLFLSCEDNTFVKNIKMSKSKGTREPIPIAPSLGFNDQEFINTPPSVSKRVLYLSIQAVINAIVIGFIAKILVELIHLITNLSFYGTFSFAESTPAGNTLGLWVIAIPIIGGVLVGIMARLGSTAIRGHGIPEAMEQVLTNESRIKPIITLLKPISAAISIGTGGPFGSEGPIISTGGALGSFAGQIMKITPNERKIMLTAGATAGMAAIFGTPVAAVLLAIELLLFEFSPRSIIPVALACATGAAMHLLMFGQEPMFGMPDIPAPTYQALMLYVVMGGLIGVLSAFISKSIYLIEDWFEKLPIHWMWWPAIGAIAIGVVGYFAPYTMGVGYSNISNLLTGNLPLQMIFGLGVLKFISWSISLGSGTSGGTLAPLFTIGGATGLGLGMLVLHFFPESDINLPTCALIGMASMFAGSARALLTSIVFAFEATMQPHGLLPLLGACTSAYFVSFFLMKGTIMTEKIQRRGILTPDAYEPDVLQQMHVGEVMEYLEPQISLNQSIAEVRNWVRENRPDRHVLIVKDTEDKLAGTLKLKDLREDILNETESIERLVNKKIIYIYPESQLSFAVEMMDRYHTDLIPVVEKENKTRSIGLLTPTLVFAAYRKARHADQQLQRHIDLKRSSYRMIVRSKKGFKG